MSPQVRTSGYALSARHDAGVSRQASVPRSVLGFLGVETSTFAALSAAGGVAIAVALRRTARQLCRSRPCLSPAFQSRRRRDGRWFQADRRITWSRGCRSCPSPERWGRATVTRSAGDSISGAFFRSPTVRKSWSAWFPEEHRIIDAMDARPGDVEVETGRPPEKRHDEV